MSATTHYKGWLITYNPKPIPARCGVDWDAVHEDYDGAPIYSDGPPADDRCFNESSLNKCKAEIDERELEK